MTVRTAPGVAVPVVAADLTINMDVDTADDLFADVVDFDPTSGVGDEATAAPDRALGAGASTHAHGSATKKRRRKLSQTATRHVRRHCQRMTEFGTARGNTPGSDLGPVEGHPAEDWAEL